MKLHLPTGLRAALIAALTAVGFTLSHASAAITSGNAAGWAVYQDSAWVTSDSFVGSIITTGQSDIQFNDAGGNAITFGSGTRSAYTFAVEVDLSKLTTPDSNTSMVWGSNKVGFGVEASTRNVTAAIGSNPKWNTTNTALDGSGTATIVVSTGNGGSRIYIYDASGTLINSDEPNNYWGGLKEGNPSTHFYIAQAISPAVTKFAVWESTNLATASATDMKSAYDAMADFPLIVTEYTWNGAQPTATWDTSTPNWVGDATYENSSTSVVTFGTGNVAKTVTVGEAILTGTMKVQDNYTFNVSSGGSLGIQLLNVAEGKTTTFAGSGNITTASLAGAGDLVYGSTGVMTLNGSNTGFTGDVTITNGTLKVGNEKALGEYSSQSKTITVGDGGTLDLNGTRDSNFSYVLAGGTLTNTGGAMGTNLSQTVGLQLTKDSTVEALSGKQHWLRARGNNATTLALGGKTLIKTGDGTFGVFRCTVDTGTIEVRGGDFSFDTDGSTAANITFNGGTVSGSMKLSDNITLKALQKASTSAAINANGHAITLDGTDELTLTGNITGATTITKTGSGTAVLSGTVGTSAEVGVIVNEGTLKATKAGALGSGGITVATDGTLDLAAGDVLASGQTVTNSGNVILHETLTTGTITGGTVTVEMESTGGLEDADGSRGTGNGFSLGGEVPVNNPACTVSATAMMYGGKDCISGYDATTGLLTLGEEDWTIYQLNVYNAAQPALSVIQAKSADKGKSLASISVGGTDDSLTLQNNTSDGNAKTSLFTGSNVSSLYLMAEADSVTVVDADFDGTILSGWTIGATATVHLAEDGKSVHGISAWSGDEVNTIKIEGSGKSVNVGEMTASLGEIQILDGVTVNATSVILGGGTGTQLAVKAGAKLSTAAVDIESVDGSTDAVMTSTFPFGSEEDYELSSTDYILNNAKLTVNSENAVTVANKRSGKGSLINNGAGKVTDSDADFVNYTALEANGGNIELASKASGVSAVDLKVAGGKRVTSSQPLTVSGSATFGAGSSVESNFVMLSGSKLEGDAATPVTLGSHTLSLSRSITLGTTLRDAVDNLVFTTDSVELFNGVTSLTINGSIYTTEVDASTVFGELAANKYLLTFGGNLVSIKKSAVTTLYWGKDKRDGYWNTLGDNTVWAPADGLAGSEAFTNGMDANFTANGGGGTITVDAAIEAASITVTGDKAYTFEKSEGKGSLAVSGAVTVASGSTATFNLALSGENTSLAVNGTMNLNETSNVKSLSVGDSGMISLAENKTVTSTQAMTLANGAKLGGKGTYKATAGVTVTGTATMAGGTLQTATVGGAGTLKVASGSTMSGSNLSVANQTTLELLEGSTLANSGTLAVAGKVIAGNGINLGMVNATGIVEVNGASVSATGGSIATLDMGAGETLAVTNDLALTSTTGTAGTLNVDGGLTVNGAVALTDVKAGSLVMDATNGSLTATGTLDAGTITLNRVSMAEAYLTAVTLSETTTNFVLDQQLVWNLGAQTGQTITLAYVDSAYAGAENLQINGAKSFSDTNRHTYTIMQDATTHDIILKVEDQESGFVWTGNQDTLWSHTGNWSGSTVPGSEDWAQVKGDTHVIELDEDPSVGIFTVSAQSATLQGARTLAVTQELEVNANSMLYVGDGGTPTAIEAPTATIKGMLVVQPGSAAQADATVINGGTVNVNDATYIAETIDMTAGTLRTSLDSFVTTGQLNGDLDSTVGGHVIITGTGSRYTGGYDAAYIDIDDDADAVLYAGDGLTLGGDGTAKLQYSGNTAITGVDADALTIILNNPNESNIGSTLTLQQASRLRNGSVRFGMSATDSAKTIGSGAPVILQGDLSLGDGASVVVNQDSADSGLAMEVRNGGSTHNLVLARFGGANTNTRNVSLTGNLYNKYFKNARIENGALLVDMRDDYFRSITRAHTPNGRAGAGMLDDALVELNPQVTNPQGDLAAVMTALETKAVANPDRVAAAVAGASAAALGHAFNNDVQRQLRAIRNRTTTMGLAECTTHEGLPYVNAWVNAEGDYRKLDADGTLAGYTLSSWGGTIGCDVDLTGRLTVGAAFTVLHGEFTSHSADMCEGDLDRDYVSLFARYGYRAWTHTFVATLGFAKSKVDRTVNYGTGSYTTRGDSDGNAFGFLYEVGYTKALNEDASTCLQPIFNVNYRHSSLGGYTEKGGSDAALSVGSADMDAVTFGLGARLQSIVGTSVYNRATLFEGRVLAKLDAGDRDCTTNSSLIGVSAKRSVKSAEVGAFGVEVGAGLTIPVGETGGSIFMDVTGDFRSGYTEFNGTVGYRFSF